MIRAITKSAWNKLLSTITCAYLRRWSIILFMLVLFLWLHTFSSLGWLLSVDNVASWGPTRRTLKFLLHILVESSDLFSKLQSSSFLIYFKLLQIFPSLNSQLGGARLRSRIETYDLCTELYVLATLTHVLAYHVVSHQSLHQRKPWPNIPPLITKLYRRNTVSVQDESYFND